MPAAKRKTASLTVERNSERPKTGDPAEAPRLEETDWDAVENAEFVPDSAPQNGDLRYELGEEETPSELDEEDDDNPYQNSDEALPDDEEERALSRDPSKEGSRFDEV